ncbi:acyl-CoA dehydrogenase family protein [Sphingomonas sp. PAMC 26605]|uniref:acyl-CoA dehydrogenase family protein n=1 Tax=Sphingomonas sp. PAMC 26605 TaxID=1112214 RepID=UPI0012F487B7|nr:acyl-CoA dehydrogenase family protein [Sphingomonas sp. PAMC 26605]
MPLNCNHMYPRHPLVTAAASLRPRLEERRPITEQIRRLPDATITDLSQAGLFAAFAPTQYGGSEASLEVIFDIVQELGQADGSVSWAYAVLAAGSWMAASFFPEAASRKVFESENPLTSAAMMPTRISAKEVDGGILIQEGEWSFNTGIHHAGWNVIGIPIIGPDRKPTDLKTGLVPTDQLTIVDDWHATGLRGSGSCTSVAKDLFVPDAMLVSYHELLKDKFPATHVSNAPIYNMPVAPAVVVRFASPAIAIARGALEKFVAMAPGRSIKMTFQQKQDEAAVTHLQIAESEAKIDAAETITRRSIAELESSAAGGEPLTLEQRARIWRDAGFASRLAWEATDLLASASGGSFARESNPINQAWRDARVATSHSGLTTTTTFEIFGRIRCGLPSNSPLLPAW